MNGSNGAEGPGFVLLQPQGSGASVGLCAMAGHTQGRPFLMLTGPLFFRVEAQALRLPAPQKQKP